MREGGRAYHGQIVCLRGGHIRRLPQWLPGRAETAPIGWPEVIADLTTQRTQAETCIGLIKSRGDAATIDSAKTTYVMAKADMDGVIAGLETVLGGGRQAREPADSPTKSGDHGEQPQGDLRRGLCDRYAKHEGRLGRDRQEGWPKGRSSRWLIRFQTASAAIWTHYVVDPDKLALETKKVQAGGCEWPEFIDIAAK